MAERQPLTAVVCRTRRQFEAWCLDNGRHPRDPSLRLVTEQHHACGCWFDDVILVDGPASLMEITQTRLRQGKTRCPTTAPARTSPPEAV